MQHPSYLLSNERLALEQNRFARTNEAHRHHGSITSLGQPVSKRPHLTSLAITNQSVNQTFLDWTFTYQILTLGTSCTAYRESKDGMRLLQVCLLDSNVCSRLHLRPANPMLKIWPPAQMRTRSILIRLDLVSVFDNIAWCSVLTTPHFMFLYDTGWELGLSPHNWRENGHRMFSIQRKYASLKRGGGLLCCHLLHVAHWWLALPKVPFLRTHCLKDVVQQRYLYVLVTNALCKYFRF